MGGGTGLLHSPRAEQEPEASLGFPGPSTFSMQEENRKAEVYRSVPEATSVLPLGQTESPLTSGGGAGGPGLQGPRPEEGTRQASVANAARDLRQPERVRLRPSR